MTRLSWTQEEMFRFIWRHKRAIAAGSLVGFGAYGAYHLWRKKRDLDELLQSVGLDELLLGGGNGSSSSSRETRCAHLAESLCRALLLTRRRAATQVARALRIDAARG